MSGHINAVFNHSCLKVPVNPENKLPAPIYEQKYISDLRNYNLKSKSKTNSDVEEGTQKMSSKTPRKETLKSLIDFYDSIPDYSDINHLSNQEFYRRIENLKAKQKSFYEFLDAEYNIENKVDNFIDDYTKQAGGDTIPTRKTKNSKNIKSWAKYNTRDLLETDSVLSSDKEIPVAPPSRRSVRIESPKSDFESRYSDRDLNSRNSETITVKSQRNISPTSSKDSNKTSLLPVNTIWDDYGTKSYGKKTPSGVRSLPSSPVKKKAETTAWRDCGITIPRPFKMTLRDEEEQAYCELLSKNIRVKEEKPEMFRAHPVPIESKIPLFDKIMLEQEIRRQIVKQRSKDLLKSQMRPFSFTRRDEEMQAISKEFSKSLPQLTYDEPELKVKPFRAKPVPKNLFSNYIYRKMHEDEFYRMLKKKIRAEELLKASSLPPSMAAREKTHKKHGICSRAVRELEDERYGDKRSSSRTSPGYFTRDERLELELEDLKDDFLTVTTPRPYKLRTRGRSSTTSKSASAGDANSERARSAPELLQSVNRSNLAAVLRIQSARKRMESEVCKKLEEQQIREQARWRERTLRRRPVWQELDRSHEQELAVRLQARRDEERLRQEEHRHRMQLMLGRVQQMPTLFERQSLVGRARD